MNGQCRNGHFLDKSKSRQKDLVMQTPLAVIVLTFAVTLTACGSGDGNEASPPVKTVTVTPSADESGPAPKGESDGCLVAANKWADRMSDHVLDAATTAPAFAETLNLDDLDDPTSEIKALCSDALAKPILEVNAKLANVNFELSLCAFSDTCDPAQTRRVRRLADQAANMVGDVREQL